MDLQSKTALMEKYWLGESSTEEEAQLIALFESQPNLFSAEEKRYLGSITDLKALKLPADFGKNVMANLKEEPAARTMKLPNYVMQLAAALLLLVGVAWGISQYHQAVPPAQKFADASTQQAYEEARQALLIISQKMSKVKSVTAAFGKFDSAQEKIKFTTQK